MTMRGLLNKIGWFVMPLVDGAAVAAKRIKGRINWWLCANGFFFEFDGFLIRSFLPDVIAARAGSVASAKCLRCGYRKYFYARPELVRDPLAVMPGWPEFHDLHSHEQEETFDSEITLRNAG